MATILFLRFIVLLLETYATPVSEPEGHTYGNAIMTWLSKYSPHNS